MESGRLEAFSDGVIAVIITIMVLELKVPHGTDWAALRPMLPTLMVYVLSFIYVGIYWNNHHHLFYATREVDGVVLWANLHLLFWLSLFPFATAWMGENHFASLPTAAYGGVLLAAALSYWILQRSIVSRHAANAALKEALGSDLKGKLSPILYAIAIPLAFVSPWLSNVLYVTVAAIWLVPDRRIERRIMAAANAAPEHPSPASAPAGER